MQEEITQFIREILLSESFSTLAIALIGLIAYKANKTLESRRDYDKLVSGIKGIVLFIQKDLQSEDSSIRSTEVWERVISRYEDSINKLGLSNQEVREIIERAYEKTRQTSPRLFETQPTKLPKPATEDGGIDLMR